MCEPLTIALISAGMSAAGTIAQQEAADDAARRQERQLALAGEEQDRLSRQAEQVAMQNAKEYDPQTRMGRFMEAREKAGDSLVADLTAARETQGLSGGKTEQQTGRLSQDFLTGKAGAAADEYQRSIDMARAMGNMRGAGDMLTEEGLTGANYALEGGMLGSQARRAWNAAQPGIAAAGRPNGTQMMLGGLLSGVGSAGMNYGATQAGRLSAAGGQSSAAGMFGPAKTRLGSGMYGIMG